VETLKATPNDLYLLNRLLNAYLNAGNADKAAAIRERIEDIQSALGQQIGNAA